ncbi:MAG TPA: hypothetical protein VI913_05650 [Candidatus Peribacteraceae bacterium]|nr:hypothetical protein [Candidatus Peribacteraceae bacterium]
MWRALVIIIVLLIAVILAFMLYEPAEAPMPPETGTGALLDVEP